VSLGSATWLACYPGYALSPLYAGRVRGVLREVSRYPRNRLNAARTLLTRHVFKIYALKISDAVRRCGIDSAGARA